MQQRDPLKLELRKHEQEARMVPGSAANQMAAETAGRGKLGRDCFDVKLYPHLEATPYGHFNKIDMQPQKPRIMSNTGERVLGDHYTRTTVTYKQQQPKGPTPLE